MWINRDFVIEAPEHCVRLVQLRVCLGKYFNTSVTAAEFSLNEHQRSEFEVCIAVF